MQGEGFYTVEETARALRLTPDRIRQMLRDGELEGVPLQEGGASGWKIPIRVIHGRDRPPTDFSESFTTGPERASATEDIIREEEPDPAPAQPRRDAAESSREPAAPSAHRVTTVHEAARILETSVDALLEAKDETIADLRDRVAFLERQLEDRAEEIRRRDHIMAALTERIAPSIHAPEHEKPPRARESTAEESVRATPSGVGGPQTGSEHPQDTAQRSVRESPRRIWWKRVLRK